MMQADALWAALPVAVVATDSEARVRDVNPAAEGLLNRSCRALEGQSLIEILQLGEDMATPLARAAEQGHVLTIGDLDLPRDGRSALRCTAQCTPMAGGLLVVLTAPDAVLHLDRGPSGKAARSAIGMAEMLAHEIKNPLAGITGAAQLLSMSLSAEDRELTDLIVAECRRVTGLLSQVEAFGNLSSPTLEPVNLHDVLDRARRSAQLGFASHISFVEDYDPSLPEALFDRDQLLQVVLNLIKNAAEASPDGGTIRLRTLYAPHIRVRDHEGAARPLPLQIEIIDNGPGLPPELADNIFDPFVSGKENGTGLGLALVSKLMRDNGGIVTVDSEPGRTAFRLSLPRQE